MAKHQDYQTVFLVGLVLSALFQLYVPAEALTVLLGGNEALGVLMAPAKLRKQCVRLRFQICVHANTDVCGISSHTINTGR